MDCQLFQRVRVRLFGQLALTLAPGANLHRSSLGIWLWR